MARLAQILRPLPGPGGRIFAPGERVDVSAWTNIEALVKQRWLRYVSKAEKTQTGGTRVSKDKVKNAPVTPKKVKLSSNPKKRKLFDGIDED